MRTILITTFKIETEERMKEEDSHVLLIIKQDRSILDS